MNRKHIFLQKQMIGSQWVKFPSLLMNILKYDAQNVHQKYEIYCSVLNASEFYSFISLSIDVPTKAWCHDIKSISEKN